VFAFLYVEANSKEFCEGISSSSFSEKCRGDSRLIISRKIAWQYPLFFVDSNTWGRSRGGSGSSVEPPKLELLTSKKL